MKSLSLSAQALSRRAVIALAAAVAALALAGCANYFGIKSDKQIATPGQFESTQSLPAQGGQWPSLDWANQFGDPQLPRHLPIVRLVDPHMTAAMSEYVVLQVLRLHRRDLDYRAQQERKDWRELDQKNAADRRVGILGFGELGQDAAHKLKALGFDVAGWSRSAKTAAGIATYAGAAGLPPLLARSEILVCLLPLTPETEGILNARSLALLPQGAALVNAARGAHLVEEDLLAALASGQVSAAVLDVFADEPLPLGHPFWHHPRIVVTPHVAAFTNPATAAPIILDNIRRFEEGRPLLNRVDPARGY